MPYIAKEKTKFRLKKCKGAHRSFRKKRKSLTAAFSWKLRAKHFPNTGSRNFALTALWKERTFRLTPDTEECLDIPPIRYLFVVCFNTCCCYCCCCSLFLLFPIKLLNPVYSFRNIFAFRVFFSWWYYDYYCYYYFSYSQV